MLFSFKPAHKFTQYTNKNDSLPVVPYKPVFKNGNVNLDYLLLPQLVTIKFTRFVQVQAGGQLAFLLNPKVYSTGAGGGTITDDSYDKNATISENKRITLQILYGQK